MSAFPRTQIGAFLLALTLSLTAPITRGETASPLSSRGYTVIPAPQTVTLTGDDFTFSDGWRVVLGRGIPSENVAVESLVGDLAERCQLNVTVGGSKSPRPGVIRLEIVPDSVSIGDATDRNKAAVAEQAYRLVLKPQSISISANAAPGLFYGVQTLLQLVRRQGGRYELPQGEIVDWPDLELRVIYWDDAHHLDHLDVLKRAIRQAAFFKINGFAIKLEGHFQYKSAAPIVEPYALTPAEYQELTDYGLRYHVQVIPFLDAPAHVAFILKHPEYEKLRAFPDSNYEFCVTNSDTYKLYYGMYQELLDANKGGKYFVLSTDEPYYIGMAKNEQCNEADRAKELGSVGKLLAEFLTKAAGYLHERGRTVQFWGEYPLNPEDIPSLPNYLVNGEVYGPAHDPAFKAHGIRQLIYTSTQGVEPLFPSYYILPSAERLHPSSMGAGRVTDMFEHISFTQARQQADLMGAFVAAWGDAGLHPETFWLGYATGPAAAWHPASPSPQELMSSFYALFYGSGSTNMGRLYQLMSEQAQFWEDSWERSASSARKPIWGDSDRIFDPPRPAHDWTLPRLPVPSSEILALSHDWRQENARRLELAARFLAENNELLDLLYANLQRVEFNRYNLEVFLSVAQLYRQNLEMLLDFGRASDLLKSAQAAAQRGEAARAVSAVDGALELVEQIRQRRNTALQGTITTWTKSWFPRVAEANGRRYLDRVDDVKDHYPVRTVDMSYLVYRELLLPVDEWAEQVRAARNRYAQAHHLPARDGKLDWKDTKTVLSKEWTSNEDE